MEKNDTSREKSHQPRGKFTQGLLDHKPIIKALNIKPGQTILDAGCGNGYMSKLFSNQVTPAGKIYALDKDPYFLNPLSSRPTSLNKYKNNFLKFKTLNLGIIFPDNRNPIVLLPSSAETDEKNLRLFERKRQKV